MARRPRCIATSRRRCSVARNRASMREGPLAELFRATEAAQRGTEGSSAGAKEPAEPPTQKDEPQPVEPSAPQPSLRAVEASPEPAAPVPARAESRPVARWL